MACFWSNKIRAIEECGASPSLFKQGVFELLPDGYDMWATNYDAIQSAITNDLICSSEYPRCWLSGDILIPYPTDRPYTSAIIVNPNYQDHPIMEAEIWDVFDVYVSVPERVEQEGDIGFYLSNPYTGVVGLFKVYLLNYPGLPSGGVYPALVRSTVTAYTSEPPYHKISFMPPNISVDVTPPIEQAGFRFVGVAAYRNKTLDKYVIPEYVVVHDICKRLSEPIPGESLAPLSLYNPLELPH